MVHAFLILLTFNVEAVFLKIKNLGIATVYLRTGLFALKFSRAVKYSKMHKYNINYFSDWCYCNCKISFSLLPWQSLFRAKNRFTQSIKLTIFTKFPIKPSTCFEIKSHERLFSYWLLSKLYTA